MRTSVSPCYTVGSPINRVRWRVRLKESEPWENDGTYWRKDFPTGRLKKLCKMSQDKDWPQYKKKHFVRRAGCERISDFRFAVIAEIQRLRDELSEKQKHGLERVHRWMNPPRRKTAQFSHELTPSVKAWSVSMDAKTELTDLIKSADNWDKANRAEVIESIENLEHFLAETKLKLQK